VRDYIFSFVKVGVYSKGEDIPMDKPNVAFDFVYVAQGNIIIHMTDMTKGLKVEDDHTRGMGMLRALIAKQGKAE
jgi:hypothetical protein